MDIALDATIKNRMPKEAIATTVVVMSRENLTHVMSLCFLDGIDAALDALQQKRDGSISSPTT